MNKDVLISIKGMHFLKDDDSSDVEVIQRGSYFFKDGNHYLCYDEPIVGTGIFNRNILKFDENSFTLSKKGPFSSSMLFDTNNKNLTNYNTPYGNIVLGIDTHKIQVMEEEDKLSLDVEYSLDVNYEFLSNCNIRIQAENIKSIG